MKTYISLAVFLLINTWLLSGQTSLGLRLGFPLDHSPVGSPILVLTQDRSQEFLFNVREDHTNQLVGLVLRHNVNHFWFSAECIYGNRKIQYVLHYTYRAQQEYQTESFIIQTSSFQLQGSIGAKLEFLEIFSGIGLGIPIHTKNELDQVMEFNYDLSVTCFNWHTGAGVRIGKALLDIRFQQILQNYGRGIFFGEKELRLKNLPGGFIVSAAFMM